VDEREREERIDNDYFPEFLLTTGNDKLGGKLDLFICLVRWGRSDFRYGTQ
jgi:hypothetical protein